MKAMAPVSETDPLWKAWERYKQTSDYDNTRRWALDPEHVDGSLWAAFMAGYQARPCWHPIDSAPTGDELFIAFAPPDRQMIVRGSILQNMMRTDTPDHLRFPATHWQPLSPGPFKEDDGSGHDCA